MNLNPYLTFNGNCKEAFTFYTEALNGQVVMENTFAEAPAEMGIEDDDKNKVMHISLKVGEVMLMGSDTAGQQKEFFNAGNNVAISLNFTSEAEIKSVYEKFAAKGTVTMALAPTFWGAIFGMVTDQFGMNWMFNCTVEQ